MLTGCQCTEAGWCERHQVQKTEHLVRLCQGNESYFDAWEKGRGPGQLKRDPNAKARVIQRQQPSRGPGSELRKILGCSCGSDEANYLKSLNKLGPDGCLEKIDEIVTWMSTLKHPNEHITPESARRLAMMAIDKARPLIPIEDM